MINMKGNMRNWSLSLLAMAGCITLAGCADSKYGLGLVDLTLGLGGDRLELPVDNSTSDILLDDILNIGVGESALVRINEETGDYVMSQIPNSNPAAVDIELNEMTVAGPAHVNPQDASIEMMDMLRQLPPEMYNVYKNTTISLADVHAVIPDIPASYNLDKEIVVFDYLYDVPEAVRSVEWADVDMTARMTLTVPNSLVVVENLMVKLPSHIRINMRNQEMLASHDIFFDETDNVIWFDSRSNPRRDGKCEYEPDGKTFEVVLDMNRVAFTDTDKNNYAKIVSEGGARYFKLYGQVDIEGKITKFIVPEDQQADNPAVHVTFNFDSNRHGADNIGIDKVCGVFVPDVPLSAENLGTVTISEIPDFLDDVEVKVDLDNPQLVLTLQTTMPLGARIAGRLFSSTYPQGICLGTVAGRDDGNDSLEIKACPPNVDKATYKVLLCAHKTETIEQSGYAQIIADPNLSKLITRLKKDMTIQFDQVEAKVIPDMTVLTLGRHFTLQPDYAFEAPLAFGEDAVIVYRKTVDGIQEHIEGLSLAEGTYVEVQGRARSRMPLNLTLTVMPVDKEGVALEGMEVVHGEGGSSTTIKAVENSEEGYTDITVRIMETIPGTLKRFDGFVIKAKATSKGLKGITLNSSRHTLKFENIKAAIVGKVIYDAN